ncbi:MAG: hypothetical protein QXS21_01350 [Thermoproteota archaeon]|nr:hypothetical protein [Candidatus Brockarchaeota archaeon]
MQSIVDNLFSVIVLFFIVSIGFLFLYPLFYVPNTEAKEHQLEDVATATFNKIISSPGTPQDWGTNLNINSNNLQAFGLAKANASIPYTLDINKILRITNSSSFPMPSTAYIDPETIAKLLGLRGENRYEFSITIMPALNISYTPLNSINVGSSGNPEYIPTMFKIKVTNYAGKPASNSNVTVTYVLVVVQNKGGNDIYNYNTTSVTTLTDWNGEATIDATNWVLSITSKTINLKHAALTILITAWYNGIKSIMPYAYNNGSNLLYASTFGNYLFLLYPVSLIPSGAFQITNSAIEFVPPLYVYPDYIVNQTNGNAGQVINKGSKKYRVYQLEDTVEDDIALLLIPVKYTGNYYNIAAFRIPNVMSFGTGKPGGGIKTVVLENLVKIGSYDYLFRLTMWRSGEY